MRPCFESSSRTCTAVDDWVHFDGPRGALRGFHEAHSNASFNVCTPDSLRKCRRTPTTSPAETAKELIKEVRLPTTTSKRRPKTTCERITGKGFWVEPGLLRGRAILIESCPLLLVFQDLGGPITSGQPRQLQRSLTHIICLLNLDKLVLCVFVGVGIWMIFAGQLSWASTQRHPLGVKPGTHGKVDLLNFGGSCIPTHAEDLVGVFWGTVRSRCMKKSLQEHTYERGHKNQG